MTPNAAAQAVIFQFFWLPLTCAMHWHRIKRRNKAFLCRTYLLFGIWGRQTCEIFVAYRSRPFSKIQTAVFSLWWCLVGCVAAMRACGRGWSTRSMVLTNQTFVSKICPIWPIYQTTGEDRAQRHWILLGHNPGMWNAALLTVSNDDRRRPYNTYLFG